MPQFTSLGLVELISVAVLVVVYVAWQVRTGARAAWRDEAEAQTARATRLQDDVTALLRAVEALRTENEALRTENEALRVEVRELRERIDTLISGRGESA